MATNYNHAQVGVVDASGNVNVIYPLTYAKDVMVEANSVPYLVNNSISTTQALAEKLGNDMQYLNDIIRVSSAANHNALYRGVDITTRSWCSANSNGTISSAGLTALCSRISAGTFDDLYIGDYFKINISTSLGGTETVTCVLADFDTHYNCGDTALTKHHAVIVPMYCFKTTAQMNSSNVTTGGYYGSAMRQTTLPIYSAALSSALNGHLVTSRALLDNEVNTNATSAGYSGWTGASSSWAWYDSTLELLSENQVYGAPVFGSSGYNTGRDKTQLNYFKYNPAAIVTGLGGPGRASWWLRAVVGPGGFASVGGDGGAGYSHASGALGVRPGFLIS